MEKFDIAHNREMVDEDEFEKMAKLTSLIDFFYIYCKLKTLYGLFA